MFQTFGFLIPLNFVAPALNLSLFPECHFTVSGGIQYETASLSFVQALAKLLTTQPTQLFSPQYYNIHMLGSLLTVNVPDRAQVLAFQPSTHCHAKVVHFWQKSFIPKFWTGFIDQKSTKKC